ncbi:MAG: hypothetical protein IVW36_03750 [Dehalococcoidia bacterium]|nr:hypothetical protein [Dehalococcoidia bacterium]
MSPLASHWFRVSAGLFVASPLLAVLVVLTTGAPFRLSLLITLYIWALVCAILALVALSGLVLRLIGRGMRVIRR